MNNNIDPICGMQGTIAKHSHMFCSQNCIAKFESQKNVKTNTFLKTKFPLILLTTILLFGLYITFFKERYMTSFMGIFLISISILKMLDWKGFTLLFPTYDMLAQKFSWYNKYYPAIEFILGIAFLTQTALQATAGITLIIMSTGAYSVAKKIRAKEKFQCACLGTRYNIPLTKLTLLEDSLMAVMSLMILLN